MRLKTLFAALAALVCAGLAAPEKAAAFGHRDHHPAGWGHAPVVKHWVYYPRYVHVYKVDPYAYQYSPRGYYPYYGSHYWVPARKILKRNRLHYNHWNVQPPRYRYYPSWGYPKKHWRHYKWHRLHHGYHHRWHY